MASTRRKSAPPCFFSWSPNPRSFAFAPSHRLRHSATGREAHFTLLARTVTGAKSTEKETSAVQGATLRRRIWRGYCFGEAFRLFRMIWKEMLPRTRRGRTSKAAPHGDSRLAGGNVSRAKKIQQVNSQFRMVSLALESDGSVQPSAAPVLHMLINAILATPTRYCCGWRHQGTSVPQPEVWDPTLGEILSELNMTTDLLSVQAINRTSRWFTGK